MYQKLLVPIDGSELSERAIPHAKAISKCGHGCTVVLLRVLKPPRDNTFLIAEFGEENVKKLELREFEEVKRYMKNLADELINDGIAADVVLTRGDPSHEIIEFSIDHQIDLIIMTTHGRSGASSWTLGSVTDRVVKRSVVPILAVRTNVP